MKAAIWWIRRDLRLSDNQALTAAMHQASTVFPVFVLDRSLLSSPNVGQARLAFLFDGLRRLDASLRSRGSALILREGDPKDVLVSLREETDAEGIFAEEDVSPYARQRDRRVGRVLPLNLVSGVTVYPPEILRKTDGSPYTVFTPFSRMWRSLPFPSGSLTTPANLPSLPPILSLTIPAAPRHPTDSCFPAGEAEAQRQLARFVDRKILRYAEDRNRLDLDGTSSLSPYLRFGMISARQVAEAAVRAQAQAETGTQRQGAETWLNELIWREFYAAILYHFPSVRHAAFRSELRAIPWRDDPTGFAAWSEGQTGYPVVDAAMRQLNATGWIHNRARMIAASFLTKDLLIDWQLGERFFMQHLLDGDPSANNGGWQWTAGTGTDAAPYFRVFSPVLQGRKFDPDGVYVRRWITELADVPNTYIHHPWEMPSDIQMRAGCQIGKDYPAPIVDHQEAKQRMLALYRQRKSSKE